MTATTPDQHAAGTTTDGQPWTVVRYGTTVITVLGDQDQDETFADEPAAEAEFTEHAAHLGR